MSRIRSGLPLAAFLCAGWIGALLVAGTASAEPRGQGGVLPGSVGRASPPPTPVQPVIPTISPRGGGDGNRHGRPHGEHRPYYIPPTEPRYLPPRVPDYRAPEIDLSPLKQQRRYYRDRTPVIRYYQDERLTCGEAQSLLKARGYRRISAFDCRGDIYGFRATKSGTRYTIRVDAHDGSIVSRTKR